MMACTTEVDTAQLYEKEQEKNNEPKPSMNNYNLPIEDLRKAYVREFDGVQYRRDVFEKYTSFLESLSGFGLEEQYKEQVATILPKAREDLQEYQKWASTLDKSRYQNGHSHMQIMYGSNQRSQTLHEAVRLGQEIIEKQAFNKHAIPYAAKEIKRLGITPTLTHLQPNEILKQAKKLEVITDQEFAQYASP